MKKGLHKSKKVCYDNPRWETGVIFGPVAQLGERTVRIRKVVGSNPFRSTKKEETTVGCLFFFGFAAAGGSTRGQFEMLGEMNSPRAKVFCLRQNTCDAPLGAAAGRRHLSCSDMTKRKRQPLVVSSFLARRLTNRDLPVPSHYEFFFPCLVVYVFRSNAEFLSQVKSNRFLIFLVNAQT